MYALQACRADDKSRAGERMQTVSKRGDGTGLMDGPARFHRSYAVYKLALLLIALQVIPDNGIGCQSLVVSMGNKL